MAQQQEGPHSHGGDTYGRRRMTLHLATQPAVLVVRLVGEVLCKVGNRPRLPGPLAPLKAQPAALLGKIRSRVATAIGKIRCTIGSIARITTDAAGHAADGTFKIPVLAHRPLPLTRIDSPSRL